MISYDDGNLDPIGLPLQLNLFHKKLLRAAVGFVGGGPVGAVVALASGGGGGGRPTPAPFQNPAHAGRSPLGIALLGTGFSEANILQLRADPKSAGCPGFTNVMLPNGTCFDPFNIVPGGAEVFSGPVIGSGDGFGAAVVGAFGMAALIPAIVGEVNGNPIRRCPRGSVLGKDDLCYNKLPKNFRKWPRAARAPVTAGDAKAIRRAESARGRVKKLAGDVGFTCKKR